jgi:hypothetical protein
MSLPGGQIVLALSMVPAYRRSGAALRFRDKVLAADTQASGSYVTLAHTFSHAGFFFGEFSEKCAGRADADLDEPPDSAPPMKVSTPTQAVVQRL